MKHQPLIIGSTFALICVAVVFTGYVNIAHASWSYTYKNGGTTSTAGPFDTQQQCQNSLTADQSAAIPGYDLSSSQCTGTDDTTTTNPPAGTTNTTANPPAGAGTNTTANPPASGTTNTTANPPASGTTNTTGTTLPDPVKGYSNICDLLNAFLTIIAEAGAIVAVLFIIWSGFLFIKAQGNPELIKKAKSTFYTTIIGTAILLGASIITKVIVDTVESIAPNITGASGLCSTTNTTAYNTTVPTNNNQQVAIQVDIIKN